MPSILNVAQDVGKGHLDLRLHRNLVEFLIDHFHRIFHGDDIFLRRGDLLQGRVQGGRLAAACGTGDKDQTIRSAHEAVVHRPVRHVN